MEQRPLTARVGYAVLGCVLVSVPLLAVTFPPVTDLPQHLAQIQLFLQALHHPGGPYVVQWYTPYTLAYVVLGALWAILPPLWAGRAALAVMGMGWVVTYAWLAARRGRAPVLAVLAAILFYGTSLYWGFVSFLVGLPVFVLWFALTTRRPDRFAATDVPLFLGVGALLYASHALWFAAGLLYLGLRFVLGWGDRRTTLYRGLSVLPLVVLAAVWYPHLRAEGFVSPTDWVGGPASRLSVSWLALALFGGLPRLAPLAATGILGVAALGGGWRLVREGAGSLDRDALLAAAIFAVAALILPGEYQNTIAFAMRWVAPAALFLALALPAPRLLPRGQSATLAGLAVALCLATTGSWIRFEAEDMAGFSAALAALPRGSHLLELDLRKYPTSLACRPFIQDQAYAQVLRGCDIGFSFARFAPMPVVYRHPPPMPWTPHLEWRAARATPADVRYFDYVLVNAEPAGQRRLAARLGLAPVTSGTPWRLYRPVGPPAPRAATR